MDNKDFEKNIFANIELLPDSNLKEIIMQDALNITPDKENKSNIFNINIRFIYICASSFIILFLTIILSMFITFNNGVFYSIYIDINPSIEINLNKYKKVISTTFLNTDAENCFSNINITGANSINAIDIIMENLTINGYMNQDHEFMISCYAKNSKSSNKFLTEISNKSLDFIKNNNIDIMFDSKIIDKDLMEIAKKNHISPGRYDIIRKILSYDNNYNFDDLKYKDVKELIDLLNQYKSKDNTENNFYNKPENNQPPHYHFNHFYYYNKLYLKKYLYKKYLYNKTNTLFVEGSKTPSFLSRHNNI